MHREMNILIPEDVVVVVVRLVVFTVFSVRLRRGSLYFSIFPAARFVVRVWFFFKYVLIIVGKPRIHCGAAGYAVNSSNTKSPEVVHR